MITLPPFKAFLASNIPSVYDNTLSYYDELTKLIAYLEQQVVPAVNETAGQVDGIKKGLEELKSYVDNYFDNLDVQEEINNKLDEMAEGGQLAGIIAQFLEAAPVFAYDSVASLIAADNLAAGCIARTAGFYGPDDKGGAYYNIVAEGSADNHKVFALDNGLYAVLIKTPDLTVNQYGAYGDGVHDDYAAIQFAIEDNSHGTVKFADCTYAIGTTLKTYADNARKTNLIFEPTSTLKALANIDALIEIGGLGGTSDATTDRARFIKGGIFEATNCTAAIEINENAMGIIIDGITINRAGTYGIYMPESANNYPSDISIRDSYINCASSAQNTTAIRCERTDNKFENLRLNNCRCAFYFTEGGQYLINCHAMGVGPADPSWYEGTEYMHLVKGGGNYLTNCYCDTLQTFVNNESTGMLTMTSCFYYSYISDVDCKIFKLASGAPNMKVVNCQFNVPTADTLHSGFAFTNFNAQTTVHNIYLNDNYVSKPDSFIAGDLLLNQNSTQLYWTDNGSLSTTQWTKIGYITAGAVYHNLQFDIAGKVFDAHFRLGRTSGTTSLSKKSATKSDEDVSIEVGVKYDNNTNGNTAYALYVRQVSGTTLPGDITVNNFNTTNKFVPATRQLKDVPLITETMDASFTI